MTDDRYTERERRAGKRYMWEFGSGMALWLLLFQGLPLVWDPEPGTAAALFAALAPVLPLIWAAVAVGRHVRRFDEMLRQVALQSFGIGFGAAMLVAAALAPLNGAGFDVPVPTIWVFIAGMVGWSTSLAILLARSTR